MMSFDSDEQLRYLRYAGRHRKTPGQLRAALWLARKSASASRPAAGGGTGATHSPRRGQLGASLPSLTHGAPPSAGGTR